METKIIRMQEVDSTNTFLKGMKTCEDDTLIVAVADYQTAGRGQGIAYLGERTGQEPPLQFADDSYLGARTPAVPALRGRSPSRQGCPGYLYRRDYAEMAERCILERQEDQRHADRDLYRFQGHQAMHLRYRGEHQSDRVPQRCAQSGIPGSRFWVTRWIGKRCCRRSSRHSRSIMSCSAVPTIWMFRASIISRSTAARDSTGTRMPTASSRVPS